MTPEEKERLQAETAKLKAETKNLKKSHWGSLTTYVSLAVGAFAVAGSVGQYQLSALSSGEKALEADKRIFNAQIEERRLTKQNVELEERAAQLLRDVDNSTKAIRELQA